MSFDIKPGQKIGLCGEAGCGKSTAFQLIQRLYDADPSGGNVMIGEQMLHSITAACTDSL